jgi:PPM family protein phosphatase
LQIADYNGPIYNLQSAICNRELLMSFLSKLFRGNGQRQNEEAPAEQDSASPVTVAEPSAAAQTEEQDDTHVEQAAAPATEAQPNRESGPTEDRPWWEDADASAPQATVERAAVYGTAPLAPLPEEEAPKDAAPAISTDETTPKVAEATGEAAAGRIERGGVEVDDVHEDGTRPLTAADVPGLVALRSRRGLSAAAQRDIGRVRSINQDNVFAFLTTLPREASDVTLGLFIVADGMGGHDGGEIASRLAVTTVARNVLSELVLPALNDSVSEALQPLIITAVQDANRAIWEHAQAVGSDMGTTCTVVLLLGQALYVGHVGDSRAYLATPTGMKVITNDHSAVGRLIQVGQLDPSEARDHPLRSQLYRTIGQHPDVLVDFVYQPLGDATHLLLCSDGLWGMVDDEVLLDVLEHSFWPQDACRELIARANLAGGDDNISAVVVTLPAQT